MHNLESFFWVLFWIYIYYGPDNFIGATIFNGEIYQSDGMKAHSYVGSATDEGQFLKMSEGNSTCTSSHRSPVSIDWGDR